MTEAQDGGLVRHQVLAQLHPRKPAHRLAVVDRVLGLRVRQVEPLLQEIDPQHLLQSQRLAAIARLRVVRLDQRAAIAPTESPRPSRPETVPAGSPCPLRSKPAPRMSVAHSSPHLRTCPSTTSFVPESINLCRASLVDLVFQTNFGSFRAISQPSIRGLYAPYFAAESAAPDGFLGFCAHGVNKGSGAHTIIASRGIAFAFSRPQANGRKVSAVVDICKWWCVRSRPLRHRHGSR